MSLVRRRQTAVTPDQGTGDIDVRAVTGVVYTDGHGWGRPLCSWNRYSVGRLEDSLGIDPPPPPTYAIPDSQLTPDELAARNRERQAAAAAERRRRAETAIKWLFGEPHYLYDVRCPGFSGTFRAVPTGVTAADLVPGVEDVAHGRIELPIPNVSPPLDAAGYVNLGMWLAIEPVTVAPITAEAGPNAWITVSPRHASITFDFGNGDSVTCPGTGVPIVDLDTLEEGPCGYTYRASSPDGAPYVISVGTTWELPYASSNGSGTLEPFTRVLTLEYDVDEIQTVGTRN